MGPLHNQPYLKRRHYQEDIQFPSAKRKRLCNSSEDLSLHSSCSTRKRRHNTNSTIAPAKLKTGDLDADCLPPKIAKNSICSQIADPEGQSVWKMTETMNASTNENQYNCANFWRSPVDEISMDEFIKLFETDSKIMEDVPQKVDNTSPDDPNYNCFNYWKVPVLSAEEIDMYGL